MHWPQGLLGGKMLSESQLLVELLSYELHVHTLPAEYFPLTKSFNYINGSVLSYKYICTSTTYL